MPSLKKLLLPIAVTVVAAALLVPSIASAQRSCRPEGSPRCQQAERFKEKRQEVSDRQKGVTPACRAAADKWVTEKNKIGLANYSVKSWKSAVKKAKTKKAKKKAKKQLKSARKQLKAAKKNTAALKPGYDSACANARVKPYSS